MKKNSIFWLAIIMAVVCVGFSSCGDDDDDDDGTVGNSAIVGSWQYMYSEEHYDDGTVEGFDMEEDLEFVHFYADGTAFTYEYDSSENTWGVYETFKYKISGKTLTTSYTNRTTSSEILSLTATELKIKYSGYQSYYIDTYKKIGDSVPDGVK